MPGWDLVADEPCVEYAVSLEYESSREGDALIRITTRSDVLPSEQAELMLRQFDAILAHFLKQPDGTEHELYTTEEGIFSISPARMPAMIAQVELVHQLVEKNAESQPDSPALEFVKSFDSQCDSASVWSYRELDEAGNQVAHLLSDMVSVGDTVAVHFPKCPEAYISILGVLKAGCSFVALDPSLPDARKKFILEDSKAACLLTDDPAAAPSDIGVPAVLIDIGGIKELPVTRVIHEPGIMSTSTCYCLYTSGTTGTPKGCEITHENTVQAMMAFQHLFEGHWQRESRWLQFAAFHFDVSVLEQYWSWSVGITVVAAPKDLILDDLVGSISKLRITHLDLTPSLARLTHPDELPDLCKGVFITGGEQLNQDILDAWGPKAVIYNAYGPTEATIGVTMYKRVPINGRPSNIGQQFPNVGSYIFHTGTEIPVLRGGVGELCVSGKLVGKGYLQRPELSKEKFPVLSYFKERVYRTGDLVRILHDGCFEFLGRADDQVKLRGQRLEIEEINQVIRSGNSQVQNAATLVISHEKKDFLVAFVTRHDEATTHLRITGDDDEITKKARKSCLEKLPGYMVPTYFIPLSYIPLSSNNKVEAKRLRLFFDDIGQERLMQFTGQRSHSRNTHLDHTTLETVVGVLAEFCRIPRVKILRSTSIFDLGVDSISALQLSTLLKNKGIDAATPARILRFPIVADLVHELAGKGTRKNSSQVAKEVKQMLQVWQYRYRGIACRELQVEPLACEDVLNSEAMEGMINHFHQMMTTVRQDTLLAENVPEQAVATTCKLSAVPHSRTENAPEQESDWTPISLALRDELCILAGISPEHIGPDTSILDLGIDSIDSIKISARLAKRDIKVSASQIVRFQTISAITGASSAVSIPQNSTNSAILADIKRGLKSYLEARSVDLSQLEDVLPPTPLQQSMIAGMIESDFEWYFNQDILELNEGVDIIRLKEAWETVVEASPILRTGFLEVDSCEYDISYCQVVFRQKQVYISLDQAEDISQLQCYLSRASNIARKGAATSGLFQVALVSTPHKSYMIISMAHAIYDGWSLGLTFQDVKAAYRDSFKPRNHWQILDSEPALFMSPKADAFWEEYLADASPTIFEKKAMDRDGSQEPEGVYRSETLSAQQVSEIGEFCKRASVSLQSLCLACWAAVSASWVQSLDTVFGVVLFGRDFEGAHELNFPTINTVAFRSLLHGSASVFLSYMESNLADVRTHQRVSLRDAQASMRLGSKRKRLFNSLFILQKSRTNQEPDAWKSIGSSSAVEYPICVEAELSEDHLVWRVACKKDHFSQSEAEEILSKLDQVLHYFLSSPESEVLSFSDDGVSICGMPSWPTKDTVLQDEEDVGADLNEGVLMDEWSETSSHIRQVLSEVSAVPLESILPASTLYHLGLDSISAIKVSLLLRRRNIRLKPRDLAEANSISEMARRTSWDETPLNASHAQTRNWKVDHFVSEEHVLNRCGVMPRDVMAVLPATPLQVYMLSVWHGSGGSVFYPEFHYEAPSTYTHGQISKAWSKVVRMVPILRARLVSTGSRALPWVQVVLNGEPRSSERFDQPLVQFLAQQSQNEKSWIIRLCIHHALYDGFSLPRIMQLYDEALQKGDLFDQAQSSVAFAKWQEFSTAPLLPANMQTRKAFWMAYLAGCGPASSRFASTFPSLGSTAARVSYLREKALVSVTKLRKLASTNGISLQSLLLAAYAKSLCPDGTGAGVESSIVFGLYLANRTSSKEELDTTYPTLNLVPLRVNLSRGDDVVNVGGAIHEDLKLIQAEGRAQVGLWEIHAWTGMQIHTFVNILSLPDGGHGADVTAQPGVMRATKQERTLDQNIRLEPLKTPWLQGNAVQDAYPVPLDVEMSVSESGLDIGVFGSTDMLSRAEAPLLVDSILEHLQDVA
ncbi:hypothetical protein UVI_02009110 [Ustilaginoidea virens]|uniref:Nonribosomal peptide synthetase sidN n=1 Tax=Ustilaginoidea virens TaxID=1159556 RepID=A0A1B5KUL5_USTVR|nr:hypothetical protein UVI_02009110 [Ustilaginoidea virens]